MLQLLTGHTFFSTKAKPADCHGVSAKTCAGESEKAGLRRKLSAEKGQRFFVYSKSGRGWVAVSPSRIFPGELFTVAEPSGLFSPYVYRVPVSNRDAAAALLQLRKPQENRRHPVFHSVEHDLIGQPVRWLRSTDLERRVRGSNDRFRYHEDLPAGGLKTRASS